MHTNTPIMLRLEHGAAAVVGSGQRETFTLYHHRGSYLTEDDPYRNVLHEPQPILAFSREVITNGGDRFGRLTTHDVGGQPMPICVSAN